MPKEYTCTFMANNYKRVQFTVRLNIGTGGKGWSVPFEKNINRQEASHIYCFLAYHLCIIIAQGLDWHFFEIGRHTVTVRCLLISYEVGIMSFVTFLNYVILHSKSTLPFTGTTYLGLSF